MVIGKCTDVFRGIFLVWGGVEGRRTMWEDLLLEEYVMGEEKFNEKGAGFSSITIKKTMKIYTRKSFQLKVKSSIKT